MNKYKTKYNKKCTTKTVTFYIKDMTILNFANSINFQKFVKEALLKEMKGEKYANNRLTHKRFKILY